MPPDHLDAGRRRRSRRSPVERRDLRVDGRVAVVPRQDVDEIGLEPGLLAAFDQRAEVVGGRRHRAPLGDVVDPALDDQRVGAVGALLEPLRDLVGALAEHAAVAELERRVGPLGPVLVLARLVLAEPERRPLSRVGVVGRDCRRVIESPSAATTISVAAAARRGAAGRGLRLVLGRSRRPRARRCPTRRARDRYVYMPPNCPPVTLRTWPCT